MSRLDVYLTENALAKSRERAKAMIKEGKVSVNGKVCTKPAFDISVDDKVKAQPDDLTYVGRGGLKLAKAFDVFGLDVKDLVCADIGASTGGFTQCLLEHGAKIVYAVDVGHGQLDKSLVEDSRVINCEGVNARELTKDFFTHQVQFISIDVSFISLELIIKPLCEVLPDNGEMAVLIKPQFEAGKKALNKKGIVKDSKVHISVLERLVCAFNAQGLFVKGLTFSAVTGSDGNIEYLAYLRRGEVGNSNLDITKLVKEAFLYFK